MAGFTDKQTVFIEEYLSCWNATEAALRAGYSERSARSIGSENLTKPNIAAEIQARIDEKAMSADEVLTRLAEQARGVPPGFIEVKAGLPFLNWQALEDSGLMHLVKKIKYNSSGQPEVEFYDAQAALIQLGRHHSLFTDRAEADVTMRIEVAYIDEPPGTMMRSAYLNTDTEEGDTDD